MVNPIPDGYPRVIPYLSVRGADAAIRFYSEVFGATERMRLNAPDGSVAHAEIEVGDALIMVADENLEWGNKSPATLGGSPVTIAIYSEDVDATVRRAEENGATVVSQVKDEFYGDRVGMITDPFGHSWHIATHIEDVSPEEMERRAAEMFGTPAS